MMDMTAATPQLLRRVNAGAVLEYMRGTAVATGTDLMQATGLTRATVIAVCEDLITRGWVTELENQRDFGDYQKGRPARRFELNSRAGLVLGIDIGVAKTTVVAADLKGETVAQASLTFGKAPVGAKKRIDVINRTALKALAEAGATPSDVLAVGAGVAAPIDRDGNVVASQPFWGMFDIDLRTALHDLHGWTVLLENDANLAALGEHWRGAGQGVGDLAVTLSSERFGAGLLESGRLLHGRLGGAGEMAYLDLIEGVGSTAGIALLARTWAAEAVASSQAAGPQTALPYTSPAHTDDGGTQTGADGRDTSGTETGADAPGRSMILDLAGGRVQAISAEMVFHAAAAADPVALDILDRLAERLARIIGSLGTLLNPELVVLGGAVAASAGVLVQPVTELLPRFTNTPPRVAVSTLGDAVVSVGAVRHALNYVETNALDLDLAG